MLRESAQGPVRFFELAHSRAGRVILTTGIYVVDGLMIDTGPANARREFDSILERTDIEQIVLTHHHEDHVGNASRAAAAVGTLPLLHPTGRALVERRPSLPLYRRFVWGTPAACRVADLGEEVGTGRHRLRVIHTPGHSPDHVVLYEPDRRWLFTGDLYIARRLKVLGKDERIGSIIEALRNLMRLPDCTLFCQHSGRHRSHQQSLGAKLDFLLGLREQVIVLHEEGRRVPEIARELGLGSRIWRWVSRGGYSGENLVTALLNDAGIDP